MLHCDLRVRWKVASDLRFRAAISEPKAPSFCGISGDLALSTRKSLAIAIVRFGALSVRPSGKCGSQVRAVRLAVQHPRKDLGYLILIVEVAKVLFRSQK